MKRVNINVAEKMFDELDGIDYYMQGENTIVTSVYSEFHGAMFQSQRIGSEFDRRIDIYRALLDRKKINIEQIPDKYRWDASIPGRSKICRFSNEMRLK